MKTNFFENVTGLALHGALNLNIMKSPEHGLSVSVYLSPDTKDNAASLIPPMVLKGKAGELDEKFFEAITSPLQKTSELFANMDAYQKALDKAAGQSKMTQDKKKKDAKPIGTSTTDDADDNAEDGVNLFSAQQEQEQAKAEKKQRYSEAMTQISELNKHCKYDEAISLLPQAEDYPDKAEELAQKLKELQKRKAQYDDLMKDI